MARWTGKVIPLDHAVSVVPPGALLGVGGVMLTRKPTAFLASLALAGRRDIRLCSFLASVDAELLAAAGLLSEARSGYVGFEHLGPAPAFHEAVRQGRVRWLEYSPLLFTAGLRAAAAGVPFMPTKGAIGSDLVPELELSEVRCPYTDEALIAAPALAPSVAVIHADAADEDGNVLPPPRRGILFDADRHLARAAHRVIVTVERLLPRKEVIAARPYLTAHQVDAIVVAPHGAYPTALPGAYDADHEALRTYRDRLQADPRMAAEAAVELVAS